MNQFMFLYPIPEYIGFEIRNGAHRWNCPTWEKKWTKIFRWLSEEEKDKLRPIVIQEKEARFSYQYSKILNKCINERYRDNGFKINWVIFKGHSISDLIQVHSEDSILQTDIDFQTHTTERPDGTYLYPDLDFILNQLGDTQQLRIAGFHMWDCVEKVAKKAYERGVNVLVDEDLTEFMSFRFSESSFRTDKYPTFNPRNFDDKSFEQFMEPRINCPWLYQDY
jgi:hypothetical protein